MKFAFIILNYNTTEQTEKCLNSIISHTLPQEEIKIALLDNGSNDSSCFELINTKYQDLICRGKIIFVKSKENLGFAGGNNLMFKKIIQTKFNADFFIFLNNDVYLVSNDFLVQIKNEYEKTSFYLAGPRIILGNNTIDTCPFELPEIKTVKKEIYYWKQANLFSSLYLIHLFLFFNILINLIKRIIFKKDLFINKSERKENILLHGACLIFSKKYFNFYNEPFDPRTFLYKEEELLFLRLLKKNLRSIFLPNLIVFHEGGVSTKKNKSINQIFKFRSKHYGNSLKILLSELVDYRNSNVFPNQNRMKSS